MLHLQKQVDEVINDHNLFNINDRILIGISGGPDSVTLFSLIFNANRTKKIYSKLYLAHLNHLLRGEESEQDEQFVIEFAKRSNVPIIVEKRDIKRIVKAGKLSLEEAAREERYRFLKTVAEKVNANVVAVGHTADDNAETILHRIIRGTGILGLNGMRPKRRITRGSSIQLVRPLLFSRRKDIKAYLKEMGLSYRIDSTNLETDKFRNRIRVELIPLLEKKYNARVTESLIKLGEIASQNNDFLISHVDSLTKELFLYKEKETGAPPNEILIDISKLRETPTILQQLIIKEALVKLGIPLRKFGHKQYKEILCFIKNTKPLNDRNINDHLNVGIVENTLCLSINGKHCVENSRVFEEVRLPVPGSIKLKELNCKFKIELIDNENGFLKKFKKNKTKFVEAVDFDKLNMPLSVRKRKHGDRFWPLGSNGTKKLKDFFIDSKIPLMERDKVPLVAMNGQPVWVAGIRIDNRIKISKETKKILLMSFEKY